MDLVKNPYKMLLKTQLKSKNQKRKFQIKLNYIPI